MNEAKIDHEYEYVRRDVESCHKLMIKCFVTVTQNIQAQRQFEKLNDIHNNNRTPVVLNTGSVGSEQI